MPKLDASGQTIKRTLDQEIEALRQRIEELERENRDFRTWGVIELAIRNPNVTSYIAEWEGRALAAEAEAAQLREALRNALAAGLPDVVAKAARAALGRKA